MLTLICFFFWGGGNKNNEKKGYSYNLMLKSMPFHIMTAEKITVKK